MKNSLVILMLVQCVFSYAQKSLYIPQEWKQQRSDTLLYKESDIDNSYTWSKTRSRESDNFICYWDKYYTTEPDKLSSSNYYYVNVEDLLNKAESFYAMNVGRLSFCDEATSKVSKYKMMILINHTTTWTCYGGGYDFTIGALWLNPATCKPVGHSVAHEVGHSFQYMCYSDYYGHSGFHDAIGNGSAFWEQTAQWQAAQSYPELKFDQSWSVFRNTHNYAMTHEWHRYQSYWWHYYLAEKYGIDIIGKIWRHPMSKAADANEVLMDYMGTDYGVNELFKDYFDYAMKMATLDLEVCRGEADTYIGSYAYDYVTLGGTKHQVAFSSCPQSTGYNIIPLSVPVSGTTVSTDFTSLKMNTTLAEGDPKRYYDGDGKYSENSALTKYLYPTNYRYRGFRLGYVALLKDGTRVYSSQDSVYCQSSSGTVEKTCKVDFTVPENVKRMWLVVVPAPKQYFQHKWDEKMDTDDQWPYRLEFTNTNISGAATIDPELPVTDATITYDIWFPSSSSSYDGTSVKVDGDAAGVLGTAFQMSASSLDQKMVSWTSAGPSDGKAMFYAVNANGTISNSASSANGYGHWFTGTGNKTTYSSGYIFSEFDPSSLMFTVGQYPGRLVNGKYYTISQAIRYKRGKEIATVTFVFNVHTDASKRGSELVSAQNSEIVTGIKSLESAEAEDTVIYDITGRKVGNSASKLKTGLYIVGNRKIYIR